MKMVSKKNIIILFSLFFIMFSFEITRAYVPLAPIEGYVTEGTVSAGLEAYVANMYRLGVGIATLLAVLMVIWGGVEYMTTDAWGHKEEGKERIQSALFGLMLALGSYVIIATIDKSILDINFNILSANRLESKDQFSLNVPDEVIEADLRSPEWITNRGVAEQPTGIGPMTNVDGTPGIRQRGESASEAILRNARAAADPNTGLHTCNVSGTSGGRKACAYAVNEIVESSLGQPITNSLSTADMYQKLKSNNYFEEVSGGVANSKAGDIIISPTANGKTGHVGIINADGGESIISNSSSQGKVLENYNASRWSKYYEQRQGLNTYIYRPR